MLIDTSFDFRVDARGKDSDSHSPTLRKYHHHSGLGEFQLSSDAVIASFTRYAATARIIEQIHQAEHDEFNRMGYTMGAIMVFPGNRVDGKPTINTARGFNRKISDRMD